jgi:hypothetical protein
MTNRTKRRVPEHVSTSIRKAEPIGEGLLRLSFAVPRGGAWDDQCTILMPASCLPDAFGFAVTSARELAEEAAAPATTAN